MKLSLMVKFYCTHSRSRDAYICDVGGRKAQFHSRPYLFLECLGVISVDLGTALFKIAVDSVGFYDVFVSADGQLIGLGILPGGIHAHSLNYFLIDHAML